MTEAAHFQGSERRDAASAIGCSRLALLLLGGLAAGCGPDVDVGSNVVWASVFEGGTSDEWTKVAGGTANAWPSASDTIQVGPEYAHRGRYGARLTIDAGPDGAQQNAGLVRRGGLPPEAYYSAWYYIPGPVTVGNLWLIFKFRQRTVLADSSTEDELYDLRLVNTPDGALMLTLYDHRSMSSLPLDVPSPVVPLSAWFQIEAFYRPANDATGRLTIWLDGRQIVDVAGRPTAPTSWVEWDVVNVGANLTPSAVAIGIDDCAVSLSRVGPAGKLVD